MHILVVRNNSNPQAVDASLMLAAYLTSQGIASTVVDSSAMGNDQDRDAIRRQLPDDIDLVIVLGGDGTVLHTVHLLHDRQIPILPVNFGRLGFLANADDNGLIPLVADALAGELAAERRSMLSIDVVCAGEPDPFGDDEETAPVTPVTPVTPGTSDTPDVPARPASDSPFNWDDMPLPAAWGPWATQDKFGVNARGMAGVRHFTALNEIAITRGALGRIIELSLSIAGIPVDRVRGDGLIVSTATGSTAYALSAGGPLVSPGFKGMVAVPLAPHTLRSRAIVTDSQDIIEVTFDDTDAFREATLFVDGEIVPFLEPLSKLYVRQAPCPITLLRVSESGFYERLARDFFGTQA